MQRLYQIITKVLVGNGEVDVLRSVPLLQGILGYPFVLPDMVGGNAYDISPS